MRSRLTPSAKRLLEACAREPDRLLAAVPAEQREPYEVAVVEGLNALVNKQPPWMSEREARWLRRWRSEEGQLHGARLRPGADVARGVDYHGMFGIKRRDIARAWWISQLIGE